MTEIQLKLKKTIDNSYKIIIRKGIIAKLPNYIKSSFKKGKWAIITDDCTKKIFSQKLVRILSISGIECDVFSFKKGEKSKNIFTVAKLAEAMLKKNYGKTDHIIALGGGVVGDIGGFLASIYMRGIPYIQIPTTLLAMVDSSIGGKTGVDLVSGKNLIGTINQPVFVLIEPEFLIFLPETQIKNGLAEIIKYGVIQNQVLFKFIEQNLREILKKNISTLTHIIIESVKIKTKIVEKDEKESNIRMILNYGHTYGHALEKITEYKTPHGFAISIGMIIANNLAVSKGYLSEKNAIRIKKLLKNAGLPVDTSMKITKKDLLKDKKRRGDIINMVLPTKIGKAIIYPQKILEL